MNYAIVAVGALILLVALGWFIWGRKTFHGSVRTLENHRGEHEDEVKDLGRLEKE